MTGTLSGPLALWAAHPESGRTSAAGGGEPESPSPPAPLSSDQKHRRLGWGLSSPSHHPQQTVKMTAGTARPQGHRPTPDSSLSPKEEHLQPAKEAVDGGNGVMLPPTPKHSSSSLASREGPASRPPKASLPQACVEP